MEYMKFLALRWCFASGSRSSLPSCTATASSLSIRQVFLMISQNVYEVTMELCHLYSLLVKSDETLLSFNLRNARSQKRKSPQEGTCYIYIRGYAYEGSNSNPKIWIHCKFCTQKYCDPAYLLPKNMGDNFILVINLIARNYF